MELAWCFRLQWTWSQSRPWSKARVYFYSHESFIVLPGAQLRRHCIYSSLTAALREVIETVFFPTVPEVCHVYLQMPHQWLSKLLVFPITEPAEIHNAGNSHASLLVSLKLSVKAESAGEVRNIRKRFTNILSGRKDKKWGTDYCRTWNRCWTGDKIMSLILRSETWTCCAMCHFF